MVRFLIHGFPHCGTTILRAILGNNPDIYEYPYEVETVDDIEFFAKGRHILIKTPFTKPDYFQDTYSNYVKIFVLRNPYHVFTSLNERFEGTIPSNHSIEKYLETAKLFIHYTKNPRKDVHCIRYEDLFVNNFEQIRAIFTKYAITYTDEVFNNTNRNKKILPGIQLPSSEPESTGIRNHATYRTWQINQPFVFKDGAKEVHLTEQQRKRLHESPIVKELGYTRGE